MIPQMARMPKRSVALRARVVSALLMHRAHMRPEITRSPKRSIALRTRVVFALIVHRAYMHRQIARSPKRSLALRARVVSALLVHRAHMRPQRADVPGLVGALRARVSVRLSKLFHHPVSAVCGCGEDEATFSSRATPRSTVVEMGRMPNVRVGWTFGLPAPLHSQDADAAIKLSFIAINNV
jgi:hypothetical protein